MFCFMFQRLQAGAKVAQAACKPGSVPGPRAGGWPFLWDPRRREPRATDPDDRPGNRPAPHPRGRRRRRPYLVLLPVGFTVPPTLPPARCALTAPFHPYPQAGRSQAPAGGLLSVALSLGSPPPGVTRHRVSVEPGLSSPASRAGAAIRPPAADALGSRPAAAAQARRPRATRPMVSASSTPSQQARPVAALERAQGQRERARPAPPPDSRSAPAPPPRPGRPAASTRPGSRPQCRCPLRQPLPVEQLAGILLAGRARCRCGRPRDRAGSASARPAAAPAPRRPPSARSGNGR